MATLDRVSQFVRDALLAGRTRDEIRNALARAGWSPGEINKALDEFADIDFALPVPRPRLHLTARDAFAYAVLFTALAVTASFLVSLVHALLDLWLPDVGDPAYRGRYAITQVRWAIATLVVSVPIYVWTTLWTGRQIAQDAGHRRSLVRKWLTYLALFVSALVIFGDAIYVVYSFLAGEFTLRFLLKAAAVAGVSVAIFTFHLRDVEDVGNEQ